MNTKDEKTEVGSRAWCAAEDEDEARYDARLVALKNDTAARRARYAASAAADAALNALVGAREAYEAAKAESDAATHAHEAEILIEVQSSASPSRKAVAAHYAKIIRDRAYRARQKELRSIAEKGGAL